MVHRTQAAPTRKLISIDQSGARISDRSNFSHTAKKDSENEPLVTIWLKLLGYNVAHNTCLSFFTFFRKMFQCSKSPISKLSLLLLLVYIYRCIINITVSNKCSLFLEIIQGLNRGWLRTMQGFGFSFILYFTLR